MPSTLSKHSSSLLDNTAQQLFAVIQSSTNKDIKQLLIKAQAQGQSQVHIREPKLGEAQLLTMRYVDIAEESAKNIEEEISVRLKERFEAYVKAAMELLVADDLSYVEGVSPIDKVKRTFKEKFDGEICTETDFQHALSDLINALKKYEKYKHLNNDKLLKQMNIAEGLLSGQYLSHNALCTVTYIAGDKILIERDVPNSSDYTNDQVNEYLKVFEVDSKQPKWFKDLPAFAKSYLQEKLKKVKEAHDLRRFEVARQELGKAIGVLPTTMRMLPGAANYMRHDAFVLDKSGKVIAETHNIRASTLMPIEMQDKNEQLRVAVQNLEEIVKAYLKELVAKLEAEGKSYDEISKILQNTPILVQSLVSPLGVLASVFDPEHNDQMLKIKEAAIEKLKGMKTFITVKGISHEFNYNSFCLLSTNHPVNALRAISVSASEVNGFGIAQDGTNLQAINSLVKLSLEYFTEKHKKNRALQSFVSSLKELGASKDLQKISETLSSASTVELLKDDKMLLSALSVLIALNVAGKHKEVKQDENLFRGALEMIVSNKMGGIVISGCKSGKDRRGVAGVYVDAMVAYFAKYGTMPKPDDKGQARINFVNIVVDIFLAGHAQELAALNSQGVCGLKALKSVLPEDVKAQLKIAQPDFFEGNQVLASQNKPKLVKRGIFKASRVKLPDSVELVSPVTEVSPAIEVPPVTEEVSAVVTENPKKQGVAETIGAALSSMASFFVGLFSKKKPKRFNEENRVENEEMEPLLRQPSSVKPTTPEIAPKATWRPGILSVEKRDNASRIFTGLVIGSTAVMLTIMGQAGVPITVSALAACTILVCNRGDTKAQLQAMRKALVKAKDAELHQFIKDNQRAILKVGNPENFLRRLGFAEYFGSREVVDFKKKFVSLFYSGTEGDGNFFRNRPTGVGSVYNMPSASKNSDPTVRI